jgi:GeoRSP system SPASM domain protein
MNLNRLAFPIRLYWDLTPHPESSSIDCEALCDQIVELKFFTLNLLDMGPALSDGCMTVLERLKNEFITVSLTMSRQALNADTLDILADVKTAEVLVDVSGADGLEFVAELALRHGEGDVTIGASLQVTEDNYRSIPEYVARCLQKGIVRLVFPMQRLAPGVKGSCFYVGREEGDALSAQLEKLDFSTMKITIHDPFLWRIFYPEKTFPGGGCQAGNSMAYIAPEGSVYPCPTMPVSLGNVNESRLKAILSSDAKKDLVKQIGQHPGECSECRELSGCMGGCTGRVYELTGSFKHRDPACE